MWIHPWLCGQVERRTAQRTQLDTLEVRSGRSVPHSVVVSTDVDTALRAVIEQRMREQGLNAPALALRAGTSKERMYKALGGERGLTPETVALIAHALGTTVLALRRDAGVLTPEERRTLSRRVPFADYIAGDPLLSQEAKDVLIRLYDQLTRGETRSSHA